MAAASNGKINSIQAYRAIAFAGVFLSHTQSPFSWALPGVSAFFVLSGFLMYYSHASDATTASVKSNLKFSWSKIRKLYPLHIITMVLAVVLRIYSESCNGITISSAAALIRDILLNVTLLQSWVPDSTVNVSLNGTAWFLSVMAFLYFAFPYLKNILADKSNKFMLASCITLMIVQWLSCMFVLWLDIDGRVYRWFMYCFPLFRLVDFYTGCCLGRYYSLVGHKATGIVKASIIEILMTVVAILICRFWKAGQTSGFLVAINNWTTIFIPLSAIWIYLFVRKEGIITELLSNKALIYIGNISSYAFLIHYIVIKYINVATKYILPELFALGIWEVIALEFILTILFSEISRRVVNMSKWPHRLPST